MHTLYVVYDENSQVTDFVIDSVPATQNFISLDRGPLSYVQSIIDNLNTYVKKNGSLTVDSAYLGLVRHGQFDQAYGTIEDKRISNSNYIFKSNPTTNASSNSQSVVKPDTQTAAPSEKPTTASESASSADSKANSASSSSAADTTSATSSK